MYEAMLMPCGSISCLKTLALYLPLALDATGGIHGFSPLHEHKPLEQGEEHFFFQSFLQELIEGRGMITDPTVLGMLCLLSFTWVTLSRSCREFLTAQKGLPCSSQHQVSQNRERMCLFETQSLPQPM